MKYEQCRGCVLLLVVHSTLDLSKMEQSISFLLELYYSPYCQFIIEVVLPMSSQLNLLAQTTPFVVESSQLVLDQTASELSSFAFTQFPVSLLCLKKKISCKSTRRNEREYEGYNDKDDNSTYVDAHLLKWKSIILTPLTNSQEAFSAHTLLSV